MQFLDTVGTVLICFEVILVCGKDQPQAVYETEEGALGCRAYYKTGLKTLKKIENWCRQSKDRHRTAVLKDINEYS